MTAQHDARGDVAVLVVAAGLGLRLGPGDPKALRSLAGEPLLVHAVRRVLAAPSVGWVVVAAPPSGVDTVAELLGPGASVEAELVNPDIGGSAELVGPGVGGSPELVGPGVGGSPELVGPGVTVVAGGVTRQDSVAAALAAVPDRFEIVLVHDAARALAPAALVETVAAAVRGGWDAVIPVLPVIDTVKEVAASGAVVGTVDRSVLRVVQTPQGFRRAVLAAAHGAAVDEHTDDAGLVEKLGVPVHTVPGSEAAFKITRPVDLVFAEALLAGRTLAP